MAMVWLKIAKVNKNSKAVAKHKRWKLVLYFPLKVIKNN